MWQNTQKTTKNAYFLTKNVEKLRKDTKRHEKDGDVVNFRTGVDGDG